MHLGYTHGTKDNDQGVNVREQDAIDAAKAAVNNLTDAKVDCVIDLGDMAHVPAPKKRAVLALAELINSSGLHWYSANGNHTLQRTRSDITLYDVLAAWCPNFHGYLGYGLAENTGAFLIPYGTEAEALANIPNDALFLAGHFASTDIPYVGTINITDYTTSLPTFLGHFHTRKLAIRGRPPVFAYETPTYIGATERFAWGEHENPTGVAVYDTISKQLDFIDHPTREWVDLYAEPEEVMDVLRNRDIENKIVRLTVKGSAVDYHTIDNKEIAKITRGALEFTKRRQSEATQIQSDSQDTVALGLIQEWERHIESQNLPKTVRSRITKIGSQALAQAGSIDT